MTVYSCTEAVHALQNEPDLDLTVEESQQRIAKVMQLATASVNGRGQVQRAVYPCATVRCPCESVPLIEDKQCCQQT